MSIISDDSTKVELEQEVMEDKEIAEKKLKEQIAQVQERLKRVSPSNISNASTLVNDLTNIRDDVKIPSTTLIAASSSSSPPAVAEDPSQVIIENKSRIGELPSTPLSPIPRQFHHHPGGHYHPGQFSEILNPAYMRYVNVNLGGLRFLGGLRTLIYMGESEPPRRILAWSCCSDSSVTALGCKIRQNSPPRFHPGVFSCFCHDCKAQVDGFETSRCAEPCQGNLAGKSPNKFSMIHKNWEKNDDEIEFVNLHTVQSIFFKSPWTKISDGKRNWFEWTCCGSGKRSEDGCQEVLLPGPPEEDTTTIVL